MAAWGSDDILPPLSTAISTNSQSEEDFPPKTTTTTPIGRRLQFNFESWLLFPSRENLLSINTTQTRSTFFHPLCFPPPPSGLVFKSYTSNTNIVFTLIISTTSKHWGEIFFQSMRQGVPKNPLQFLLLFILLKLPYFFVLVLPWPISPTSFGTFLTYKSTNFLLKLTQNARKPPQDHLRFPQTPPRSPKISPSLGEIESELFHLLLAGRNF